MGGSTAEDCLKVIVFHLPFWKGEMFILIIRGIYKKWSKFYSYSWNKLDFVLLTWLKRFCMFGFFSKPALYFIFILTAHSGLLTLRNSREPFSIRLRAFWNRKKRHRNVKNVALNRPQRGHLFIVQGWSWPCSPSAGACTSDTSVFHLITHVYKWPRDHHCKCYWFEACQ